MDGHRVIAWGWGSCLTVVSFQAASSTVRNLDENPSRGIIWEGVILVCGKLATRTRIILFPAVLFKMAYVVANLYNVVKF